MKLASKVLHELARRTLYIRHQRITRLQHTRLEIIQRAGNSGIVPKKRPSDNLGASGSSSALCWVLASRYYFSCLAVSDAARRRSLLLMPAPMREAICSG